MVVPGALQEFPSAGTPASVGEGRLRRRKRRGPNIIGAFTARCVPRGCRPCVARLATFALYRSELSGATTTLLNMLFNGSFNASTALFRRGNTPYPRRSKPPRWRRSSTPRRTSRATKTPAGTETGASSPGCSPGNREQREGEPSQIPIAAINPRVPETPPVPPRPRSVTSAATARRHASSELLNGARRRPARATTRPTRFEHPPPPFDPISSRDPILSPILNTTRRTNTRRRPASTTAKTSPASARGTPRRERRPRRRRDRIPPVFEPRRRDANSAAPTATPRRSTRAQVRRRGPRRRLRGELPRVVHFQTQHVRGGHLHGLVVLVGVDVPGREAREQSNNEQRGVRRAPSVFRRG